MKVSHTNTNLFKDFSANTLCMKHIPEFLQLSQKQTNLKMHSLTKNFFRSNIFATYFSLKLIFFPVQMYLVDYKFLALSKKSWLAFIKIIADHFYHIINAPLNIDWLASYSSYKILIGSFEVNRKPVEILLTDSSDDCS